jgi:hypothetical protein
MLYARVDEKSQWPNEWDEVQDMFQYMTRMIFGYQLSMEKKMFATQYSPEYRCTLVKWAIDEGMRKRSVLLETSDICQMKAALLMLISEAEQEGKKHKRSMVP